MQSMSRNGRCRPIGPESQWTSPEDATCALAAARPCSFAATVIEVTAIARCGVATMLADVPCVPPLVITTPLRGRSGRGQ